MRNLMTDTVTIMPGGNTGMAGHGFLIFSRPCPLLTSLTTLSSLITDCAIAVATEHEIDTLQ